MVWVGEWRTMSAGPEDVKLEVQALKEGDSPPQPASYKDTLLQPEVSWSCFATFMACCMMSISSLVFINIAQTYVLIDILNYPRTGLGNASGTLAFADELLCVPMVSFWGFLSDRSGRRLVMSSGLALMAAAIFLYPWAKTTFPGSFLSFFSSLLCFRLLFAIGGSATTAMITALIGDYAVAGGRAKVAGFTGMSAGLGALLAALVFTRLPMLFAKLFPSSLMKRSDIIFTFSTTATLILLTAILSAVLMIGPQQSNIAPPLAARIREGVMAIRKPLVAIAYLSGFVARADSIALNLFMGPWVDNYLTQIGVCPPPKLDDKNYVRCEQAKRLTSNLMSVSHLATLLCAPFFGILSDRLGLLSSVMVPAAMGVFAFGGLYFTSRPDAWYMYLFMAFCGFADIGMIISSMALISSQSSATNRGALSGVFSLFGAVGILVTSKLGGFMFDKLNESAPFSIVSASSAVLVIAILVATLSISK